MSREAEKFEIEGRMRALLRSEGMPAPDEVEYGETCVRFLFHVPKVCVVVDLDDAAYVDHGDAVTDEPDAEGR